MSMKNHSMLFHAVFAQAREAIFIIDPEPGKIVDANLAAECLLGFSHDEFLSMRASDLNANKQGKLRDFFVEVMRRGQGANDDLQCITKSGELIDVGMTASSIDVDGRKWLMASLSDLRERKAAQKLAGFEAEKFQTIFEHAFDSILVLQDGRVKLANKTAGRLWRGDVQALVGTPLLESVYADDHDIVWHHYQARLNGSGGEKPYELRIVRKDGTLTWVESVGNCIEFDGKPADLVLFHDISERKRLEAEIERRERQLSVLAEAGRLINRDLTEMEVGRALVHCGRRLVAADSGCVGLHRDGCMVFSEYFQGDAFVPIDLTFAPEYGVPGHVLATRQPYLSNDAENDVHVIPEIQQALDFYKLIDVPILDAQGELLGCFEMHDPEGGRDFDAQDMEMMQSLATIASGALKNARMIGELKDIGASLQVSEKRFRELVTVMPNGMIVVQGGRVMFANPAALAMFDYAADESIGQPIMERIHPDFQNAAIARVKKLLRAQGGINQIVQEVMLRKDGTAFDVEAISSYTEYDGQAAVLVVLRDISQQVEAEKEALQSAEIIHAVARNMAGIVFQFAVRDNGEWYFPYVSAAVERYLGISAADAMADLQQVFARAHPEDVESLLVAVQDAVAEQGPFAWHGRFIGSNDEVMWFSCSSEPQQLEDGTLVWNGVAVDETRQHQLQTQLLQAQKMDAVGTLVGGIAHDFNNVLAGMLGQLYLMKTELQEDAVNVNKVVNRIDAVVRHGRSASQVIEQLMTFARKGKVRMQRVDLNRLIADAMHLHRVSIPENIRLEEHVAPASLAVRGDAGLIQQMLLNLLTNARDALADCSQPHISLSLETFEPDADFRAMHAEFNDCPHVCLAVRDNGCGMSAATVDEIFTPFFTTKGVGKGSGLGLSMIYGGMQMHDGHVVVESTTDKGSCFQLYFPLLAEAATIEHAQQETIHGSGQCILLADDQPGVLNVMSEVLISLGYQVLTATDGKQAEKIFFSRGGDIALAILDVVMPQQGGIEAAKAMRELKPDLPLIFHTGYGEEAKLEAVNTWTRCIVVKKPASIEALSRSIAELLQ
ncbi:MAG: PAS domain S-box protein [Mariprofundaceae bacterium]